MIFNPVIAGGGGGGAKVLRGSLNKTSYSASTDKKFTIAGIDFTPTDFMIVVVRSYDDTQPIYISYDSTTAKTTMARSTAFSSTSMTITKETFSNTSSAKIYWSFADGTLTLNATKLYNSDSNQFFKTGTYEWVIWGE